MTPKASETKGARGFRSDNIKPDTDDTALWEEYHCSQLTDETQPQAPSPDPFYKRVYATDDHGDSGKEQIWGCTAMPSSANGETASKMTLWLYASADFREDVKVRLKVNGGWLAEKTITLDGPDWYSKEWTGLNYLIPDDIFLNSVKIAIKTKSPMHNNQEIDVLSAYVEVEHA